MPVPSATSASPSSSGSARRPIRGCMPRPKRRSNGRAAWRRTTRSSSSGSAASSSASTTSRTALETARRAIDLAPRTAIARAIEVDALVELGRYDEADDAAAAMLALGSDLTTLSRVSYLAELHGQLDVAVTAMRAATKSEGVAPENLAFTHVQLGNLLVYSGDPRAAAEEYDRALELVPGHAPALAGQGRLAVADGRLDEAIDRFQQAADVVPLPEYVIALADAQAAAGRTDDAARSVDLARAEIQLFEATGVMVDLDLALFEADHGDPDRALAFAEAAYRGDTERPCRRCPGLGAAPARSRP